VDSFYVCGVLLDSIFIINSQLLCVVGYHLVTPRAKAALKEVSDSSGSAGRRKK
jgi:hypothetical protein